MVADNERHRAEWSAALRAREIDPDGYLWERGPCMFPGVRRYSGRKEIVKFHGDDDFAAGDALELDSNTYPKHVWAYVLRGRPFQQYGPTGYALAHLFDHKAYESRARSEAAGRAESDPDTAIPGLFTSVANTAFVPVSLLKPTDAQHRVRGLLLRRAEDFYGKFCRLLPPPLTVPTTVAPGWGTHDFEWAAPVGTMQYVPMLLYYRAQEMAKLLA